MIGPWLVRHRYETLAFALTIAWVVTYVACAPWGLCDENGHMEVIYHLWYKKPGLPEFMPMLPGYHFVVLGLTPGVPSFASARLVSGAAMVFLLVVAGAIGKLDRRAGAGLGVALLACLPLLQPFAGLAYTDALSTLLVFCVWWAQRSGRPGIAGLSLALACAVRQTNVLWGLLGLVSSGAEAWREGARGRVWVYRVVKEGWGILVVWIIAAAIILIARRVTLGSTHGNQIQPNPAALHFAALLLSLLALPLWPWLIRQLWQAGKTGPRRVAWGVAALAPTAVLALTFTNPHTWNRELFWSDAPFTLLRNWPLVYMERIPLLRWISSANLVVVALVIARFLLKHPKRIELGTILVAGLAILMTNGLVEPRYLMPALPLALLFLQFDEGRARRLLWWWLFLCAAHAPFIAAGKSIW